VHCGSFTYTKSLVTICTPLPHAGFLNWCHYRSVWLSVQQFVPYFLWVGAWWLLITRRPPYYKRYRQPLVLLMRCGALISEARALRDGGSSRFFVGQSAGRIDGGSSSPLRM
jgi:hypothetical protein